MAITTLTLNVAADNYLGDPQFVVRVDGVQYGGIFTATASHANGLSNQIQITGDFSNSRQLMVEYLNDKFDGPQFDRNLYINSLSFESQIYTTAFVVVDSLSVADGGYRFSYDQSAELFFANSKAFFNINGFGGQYLIDPGSFGTVTHDPASAGAQVYALYDGLLGRAPDVLGLGSWTTSLQQGASLQGIAQGFLASTEGQARFSATDDAGFIQQMYQENLGRSGSAPEVQDWLGAMAAGATRADVALGFALSPEHLGNLKSVFDAGLFVPDQDAANVARLYYGVLDRTPDMGGLHSWTDLVEQGTSLQGVARGFLASDEYEVRTTGLTDMQFIESMYQQILGRAGESAGVQGWSAALSQGTSRAAVSNAFTDSLEFQSKFGADNAAYVQGLYQAVLGRSGDDAGVQGWTTMLNSQALTRADVAHAFTASTEFQAKYITPSDSGFVTKLYEDALGRSVDASGLQFWTDALAHGTSRADVAVAVSTSLEAQLHWVSAIEQGWHLA